MSKIINCPCNPKKSYTLCCGRYHKGNLHAPTAESLMRSRYSAYVLNKTQYIYRTWDAQTRPPLTQLREKNTQQFNQLKIINTLGGGNTDETGTVEFSASFTTPHDKNIHIHHEKSTFIKHKGQWYYVDALED